MTSENQVMFGQQERRQGRPGAAGVGAEETVGTFPFLFTAVFSIRDALET